MYDVDDFIRAADGELREYDTHAHRFEELRRSNTEKQAELKSRLQEAQGRLAETALSDMSEASVSALAQKLGLPALMAGFREMADRGQRLAERLAQIESNPAYTNRELRRLQIDTELREVEPLYNDARAGLEQMSRLSGLDGLITRQWGTPQYPHQGIFRFFKPEYLHDWKNADAAVAALKAKNFAEVAQRYADRKEQNQVLGERVGRRRDELKQLETLEWEVSKLEKEQLDLPNQLKARLGSELASYLVVRGPDSASALPDPESAKRGLAAVEGIKHQITYLEETANKLEGDLSGLLERSGRLRDEKRRYESERYRYRNKAFSQDQWDKRFGRATRYRKVGDRYEHVTEVVYVYDRYDYVSPWEEFLWWDVITDGRIDGNFIPEVAEYRDTNPNYSYDRSAYSAPSDSASWDRDDS